eukprot:CAMPEP_0115013058 /NCGR_PEP_ID=MMETSP0216-20121206/25151_1 /TAXON_ID=223996 /ORGANISM="Protocruzia adherens, Strain Boccale" /LENGTH=67 /DNA_ID=CAMNT_0002382323 /DNA_START=32 /DNA_END=232 /DNA_ORIENTATION=+
MADYDEDDERVPEYTVRQSDFPLALQQKAVKYADQGFEKEALVKDIAKFIRDKCEEDEDFQNGEGAW